MGRLAEPLQSAQPPAVDKSGVERSKRAAVSIEPAQTDRLAVVIPTLNEESTLPRTLESLSAQSLPAHRILVVDGGSTDGTMQQAERFGTTVFRARQAGRGCQIAQAVSLLAEQIVVVAHADMRFPREALATIGAHMADNPECPGGCLGHRFERANWVGRLVEWGDRIRAVRWGISYGDQAQFFRRAAIAYTGGFPDLELMEDLELSRRLRALGRPAYLGLPVTVSARRFERRGWWRSLWTNYRLRRAFRRGGPAACRQLAERYYKS